MASENYRKYNKPIVLSGSEVHWAWLSESLVAPHELNNHPVSTEGIETESIDQQFTAITLHRAYHTPHKVVRKGHTAASLVVKERQTLRPVVAGSDRDDTIKTFIYRTDRLLHQLWLHVLPESIPQTPRSWLKRISRCMQRSRFTTTTTTTPPENLSEM